MTRYKSKKILFRAYIVFLSIACCPLLSLAGWEWVNPKPVGASIYGIWGPSSNDLYAVGKSGCILHWNGSEWSTMDSPVTSRLVDIHGTGPEDIYVAGWEGVILHWDGLIWTRIPTGFTDDINCVWCFSSNDVYFTCGEWMPSYVLPWDGNELEQI